MFLTGDWDCPRCENPNTYGEDFSSDHFNGLNATCEICGKEVKLGGFVELVIEVE